MKIRSFALTLSVSLGLLSASCDSDGGTPPVDSSVPPVDSGGDATVSDAGLDASGQCVAANSAYTRPTLETASTAGKACTTASYDLDVVCTTDLEARATNCAIQSCVQSVGSESGFKSCITTCMAGQSPAPSTGCLNCYADSAWCSTACISSCLADPSSSACVQCRITNGCYSSFFACSGLPDTTPTP